MNLIDLGGHSGCRILLYQNEKQTFVRKISSDIKYNERLEKQAIKQKKFNSNIIKTPKILNLGYNEQDLFYFDMEYIQGITLSEYIKTIEICKVRSLVNNIIDNIICNNTEQNEVNEEIFYKKIESLNQKLKKLDNEVIDEAINLLKKHSWKKFEKTPCHGDLTLENIIVKGDQLYVIDFLDSFYDCWIMDLSTLLQDAQILWSYRYEEEIDINTILRLITFRDILIEKAKEKVGDTYIEIYYALLLKLVRIYPYIKDEKTYKFLNEKTKSIIEIIREINL